jgi:DNA-binding XRE family transcriptional regulator
MIMKRNQLKEEYALSQRDVAEKMFLSQNTIITTERAAIAKFKQILAEKGISVKDLLVD